MNSNQPNLKSVFSQGWTVFWRRPGLSLGGFLAGYLIGKFLWPFIGGPIAGGLSSFLLKTARQDNPDLNDLFSGLKDFWRWTGIAWLWIGIHFLFLLPAVGISHLIASYQSAQSHLGSFFSNILVMIIMIIAIIVVTCGAAARWGFVFFIATDGFGVLESFRRSYELTRARWLRLWFTMIVLSVFACSGVILLCFGMFLTLTIGAYIFTALYLQLKGELYLQADSEH